MTTQTDLPLVSIITPSYNQAQYLEETIRSVLAQDYPNLEYIVIDGGSDDGSLEIIQRYAGKLAYWVSEPDSGQAEAINKGLAQAKGEIVAWLNSDDVYRPGAIQVAVEQLLSHPEVGLIYAQLDSIDREGAVFNTITYRDFDLLDLLSFHIIGQPTVFMRRDVLDRAGSLDPSYNYLLDHHLWLRMARLAPIQYVPAVWAAARHHASAKNVAQAARFGEEAFRILDWAEPEPMLGELVRQHRRRVRAGAHRLDARYLLDGGEPRLALKAYSRVLANHPSYVYKHWHRILFALISLLRLGWLLPLVRHRRIHSHKPILVTGPHRSGTTWVGRMLVQGGDVAYVSEPLNVLHRPGVMDAPVHHWYRYVSTENEAPYVPAFNDTLKLRYKTWKEIRALRSLKDLGRMLRDWSIFTIGRIGQRRVLLKDPFAVFSTEWFAQRLGCDVVIVLRHPAAFVSSLKRLEWPFDFQDLLDQPLLMRDWLDPFRSDMEFAIQHPDDLIYQGSLLWRMICHVTHQVQQRHPEFHVVLHEDLSRQPVEGFETLYAELELPYTSRAIDGIQASTSADNPSERPEGDIYTTRLDSAAILQSWKQRLEPAEVERIRSLTGDYWGLYYTEEDWA